MIILSLRQLPHNGQAPQCLSDCVSTVSAASHRYRLRSSGSALYVLPRTRTRFGERGFFYCGLAAWNTLPSDLHDITDTSTFRKRLKSVIFDRAYHWPYYCWRSWTCRIAAHYKYRVDWLIDWTWTLNRFISAYIVVLLYVTDSFRQQLNKCSL